MKDQYSTFAFENLKYNKTAEDFFNGLFSSKKLELIESVDSFENKNPSFTQLEEEILQLIIGNKKANDFNR